MNPSRPSFDELGIATARLWATRSADAKVQVGACLLDHFHRVVGVGYNGRAAGEPNERESLEQGQSGFIHAEVNALLFATRDTKGATAYITDPPCPGCRKALAAAWIVRAVWPDGEHDADGLVAWDR